MAKLVAWESQIGWFACVNFVYYIYKVCLVVAIVTYACTIASFTAINVDSVPLEEIKEFVWHPIKTYTYIN